MTAACELEEEALILALWRIRDLRKRLEEAQAATYTPSAAYLAITDQP